MPEDPVDVITPDNTPTPSEEGADQTLSAWEGFKFLDNEVYSNSLLTWLFFVVLLAMMFVGIRIGLGLLNNRLKSQKEEAKLDADKEGSESHRRLHLSFDWMESLLVRVSFVGYLGASIILSATLTPGFNEATQAAFVRLGLGFLLLQAGFWGTAFLDELLVRIMKFLHISDEGTQTAMGVLRFFGFFVLWAMVVTLILVNLNVQITPLLAGMGVGGIAVAFALQKILADIFSSVAIVLDRPFEVGDFIIIGGELGTVERIGIKTTRIRSLSGEQVVVSNDDLLNSRVRNFKKMEERRVVFNFGVLYQTPVEELEKIGQYVREIVEVIDNARFDRAHFFRFGDSSYDFEVVYHVLSRDFNIYMDIQQKINISMVRKFAEQNIEIAYPTRTLYMEALPTVKIEHQKADGDGAA